MKVLQIWIGDILPNDIKNSMLKIKNLCKKHGIEYVLISEKKFFRGDYTWIDYQTYVTEVIPSNSEVETIWNIIPNDQKNHQYRSDILRFLYLLKNKNILYIDSDIELKKLIEVSDCDMIAPRGNSIDHCIMYRSSNDNTIFEEILMRAIQNRMLKISPPMRSWIYGILQKYADKFQKIDSNVFIHF